MRIEGSRSKCFKKFSFGERGVAEELLDPDHLNTLTPCLLHATSL